MKSEKISSRTSEVMVFPEIDDIYFHPSHKKKGEALGKMPPLEQRKEKRG
jgi:hypothetical protein